MRHYTPWESGWQNDIININQTSGCLPFHAYIMYLVLKYVKMGNNYNLEKSLIAIKNVANNDYWFRGDPYYWASASLDFAYAAACVEVVAKENAKAKEIYNQIIEDWGKPGVKNLYEKIWAEVPETKQEEVKQALIHPEKYLLPDPNKAFTDIEKELSDFSKVDIEGSFFNNNEDIVTIISHVLEFIIVGFNRTSDINKNKLRVLPSDKHTWLILAIIMHTATEYAQISIEKLRNYYRLPKGENSDIRFEEPMSRSHRRMIKYCKAANLRLKNDRIFMNAARHWYQCRVVFSSVNKYCEATSNYYLDPKNINKQIRPCDDVVGYIRRRYKK